MLKRHFAIAALGLAVVLAACGKKEEAPAPAATDAASAAAAPGKWPELRIAIDPSYKPFTFKTEAGEPTGFDVGIAKALCTEIKSKCTFVEQNWDGMIPGLLAKKYDAIISSMSITEERKKQIAFSGKYYNTPSCVVVKTEKNLDGSPAGFKGLKIGVLKGSTQENFAMGELKPAGVTIVPYDAQDQVYLDIASGRLDGTVADVVEVTNGFINAADGKGKAYSCAGGRIPASFDAKYFGEGVGVALRNEDTELRDAFSNAITAIRGNGTWQKIADEFVPGVDIWGQ